MIIKEKKETSLKKTLKILSAVLILLLFICPTSAQNKLFERVYNDVKKIENLTKEPIIIIGPENSFSMNTIRIKNNSNVVVWESYYVFYKEANKNKLIKYVETLEEFEGKKIFKSQIKQFINDTIFEWLTTHKQNIQNEEILPFIYVDTVLNLLCYKKGFLMHTFPVNIKIKFYSDRKLITESGFAFDEIAMQPSLMPGVMDLPKNLNFEYNRRLKVFQLYTFLRNILTNYADEFKFF